MYVKLKAEGTGIKLKELVNLKETDGRQSKTRKRSLRGIPLAWYIFFAKNIPI